MFRRNNRFQKRFKQKKPILKTKVFWDCVLGFVFIVVFVYFLFFSPVFEITDVGVIMPSSFSSHALEIERIAQEEIHTQLFGFIEKNTYFLVDEKSIENRILDLYPEIKNVSIRKEFLGTLVIEIKLRQPVAIWCYQEMTDCFLIDNLAIIFSRFQTTSENAAHKAEAEQTTNDLLLIICEQEDIRGILENAAEKKVIDEMLLIYDAFLNDIEIEVDRFVSDGQTTCNVKTKEGWDAYFKLGGDIKLTLTKLKLLFEKEISKEQRKNLSYIDLRFSKVYYK